MRNIFGDEIEHIRTFDIESQRSVAEFESVAILAAGLPEEGPPLMGSISGGPA